MDEARLGDGIGDRGTRRAKARHRRDVDDAAAALALHDRRRGLGAKHRPGEVDVEDLGPFLVGEVVEVLKADRLVVGGIVDQDVEPAEALDHVVDQALHLVAPSHVTGERRRADLVLLEVMRHALGLILALGIDDGDVTALVGERMTDALAQPAVPAGDDGDRPFQFHGVPPIDPAWDDDIASTGDAQAPLQAATAARPTVGCTPTIALRMRIAPHAAPKPLSMLVTSTSWPQLASIEWSAVVPPAATP